MNEITYIDSEVHLLPPEWCKSGYFPPSDEKVLMEKLYLHPEREEALPLASVDGLLKSMETSSIDGAVIMGLPWISSKMNQQNNKYISDLARKFPGRFCGMGVSSTPGNGKIIDEIAEIDEVLGLRGLKVIPGWQGFRLDDEIFEPALAELEKREMILFPHIDQAYMPSSDSDHPSALLTVAKHHPELKIAAPHLGGLLCLYNIYEPVGRSLDNILFIGSVPKTMKMISWAVDAVGEDRVAFGTDFPFNPTHDQVSVRDEFEKLPLAKEEKLKVAGENAARFFGMEI